MSIPVYPTPSAMGFVTKAGRGRSLEECHKNQDIYRQGDPSIALFYIHYGKIKVGVTSAQGKEAVFAVLGGNDFFGEGCLVEQSERTSWATALGAARVMRIERSTFVQALQDVPDFARFFLTRMVARSLRTEAHLVDQLSNSAEKRLARLLLNLADDGNEAHSEPIATKISQETLATMIGTSRSRVSFFMNRFRKLGYIEYKHRIEVKPALLTAVLNGEPRTTALSRWPRSKRDHQEEAFPS
jgi:CRP-like cAMP-binding protein